MRDSGRKGARLVFTRQNREFEFDRDMAAMFLRALPRGRQDSPVAVALRRHFAHGAETMYAKDTTQMDEAWRTGDWEKRRRMLKSRSFLGMLDERQANDILESLDTDLLKCLYQRIKRAPMGVLPASPRLSTRTRIKLMLAALATHEQESAKDLEEKIRELIRTDAALGMGTDEFPPEHLLEDYLNCLPSAKFRPSPASMLASAPVDSGLSLILRRHIWNQEAILQSFVLQQRHGLWEKVILQTETGATALSLLDILTICAYCDLENADPELVAAFFEIGHPLVRKEVIYADLLNQTQRDRAWQQGDVNVCRELLKSPSFLHELTDGQAEDIVALNDQHMLQSLACDLHYLYINWAEIEERRLSPKSRDNLLMALIRSSDKDTQRLLNLEGIPEEIVMGIKLPVSGKGSI